MAEVRTWTKAQEGVIEERGKTLLLSAAAGSGKTATLTERVIRTLTDRARPTDITRMLIVTFTNAAAGELRDRISAALSDALCKSPGDIRLARQLLLLPDADICTIDGFCRKLLREHATDAGLSPDFRISDEAETACLERAVMESLVNRAYGGEDGLSSAEEFSEFAGHLVSSKNEASLIEILISLYNRAEGFPEGAAVYRKFADAYANLSRRPEDTPWGESLCRSVTASARDFRDAMTAAYEAIAGEDAVQKKYGPAAASDLAYLDRVLSASGYDCLRAAISEYPAVSLSSLPASAKSPETDDFHTLRVRFQTERKGWLLRFLYSSDEWALLLTRLGRVLSLLARLLDRFSTELNGEMRRRNLVSFGDLEHLTLSLLNRDGTPTPLAREIGAGYDFISIDEYQDINTVQHRIFESISGERNRFMVGDIKQSIYSFRLAEPEIFASLRAAFPPLGVAGDSPTASVFMSENFRCDRPVIDFVNTVFDRILGVAGESIGYVPGDRLTFAKLVAPEVSFAPVTVAYFDRHAGEDGENGEAPEPEEDSVTSAEPEAAWVASEISRLLSSGRLDNGDPIRPGNIAILLRSAKRRTAVYRAALRALGIPVVSKERDNFFLNPEVLLALCLLNTVDNPRRDIYLAGLLRSPLFDFPPEELLEIRRSGTSGLPLFDALTAYCEMNPGYTRGARFLTLLARLREAAEGMPVDRLLRLLYTETGLLSAGGSDGSGGRRNLLLLYHFARSFAATSHSGLYQFIGYLNEIIREKRTFRSPGDDAGSEDAVQIMTIHSSKGLEFPVCFVVDAGRSIASKEDRNTWSFDSSLGFALKLRDETGFARVENPVRLAVADSARRKSAEEEMRLFYVALTRARERLYVTGTVSGNTKLETFLTRCRLNARSLSGTAVRGAGSYLEWVLSSLNPTSEAPLVLSCPKPDSTGCAGGPDNPGEPSAGVDFETVRILHDRFSYSYPFPYLSRLPGKLSVSSLSPTVLDGTEHHSARIPTQEDTSADGTVPLPRFYGGEDPGIAARRGTATHEFLQFCSFRSLSDKGTDAELERLRAGRFLSEETLSLVHRDELEAFRRSDLLRELLDAGMIRRELRFNVMLPASLFSSDPAFLSSLSGQTVLVQGVMDCIFEGADGRLTLLDYKTDRFSSDERRNPEKAEARLRARHREQLFYYAEAVERMFGRRPDRILLYSLCLGRAVPVSLGDLRPVEKLPD